jgi:exodeoxyribonuclease V alpha subunit
MSNVALDLKYLRSRFVWDRTHLMECEANYEDVILVKITLEEEETLQSKNLYRFFGYWKTHYKYGRQFQAQSFINIQPHDEESIKAYLHAMNLPRIGTATINQLWHMFGSDAVKVLREEPEKVLEKNLRGLKAEHLQVASNLLQQEKHTEDALIDLTGLFQGYGFPKTLPKIVLALWGLNAHDKIKQNPYILLEVRGVGFTTADKLYIDLGHDPFAVERQMHCLYYAMKRDMSGHTWYEVDFIKRTLEEHIGTNIRAKDALREGMERDLFAKAEGHPLFTIVKRAENENDIADNIDRLNDYVCRWPTAAQVEQHMQRLTLHQRRVLKKALQEPIAFLTGCPGTGKTYTAATLIRYIIAQAGRSNVAVACPTGKAAVRITEILQEFGVDMAATTIHRLLEVCAVGEGYETTFRFTKGRSEPLEQKFIFIDETTMCSAGLMADLLNAVADGAHVLFVGDLQQLPPVGHGAPMRDMIESGMACGELVEIQRNSGEIVRTCKKIKEREDFKYPRTLDVANGMNLMLMTTRNNADSLTGVIELIQRIRTNGNYDPVWEVQILVAVNKNSVVSRENLNTALQALLNPENERAERFWHDDKIICTQNGFYSEYRGDGIIDTEGQGVFVANGDIGRIIDVTPTYCAMQFDNPQRTVASPLSQGGFELGYAITCHKFQGSEVPIALVVIDEHYGAKLVCDRSWIYTAISRAKKACIMIGKEDNINAMCRNQHIARRRTLLVEKIRCHMNM